ncbi:cupin domain-containing protein [Archangium sp.]|uniref:cupin domain-containing protein n=1 Tax=Archangium sp. TaxID=1872627 RepID=UPI00286D566F|nr:cupin domain-containing protein [Archangium sp.]
MFRRVRLHRLLGLGVIAALAGVLTACGGEQPVDGFETASTQAALGSVDTAKAPVTPMVVYSPRGKPVSEAGFIPLGAPEGLGGRVLEGDPQIFARIDYSRNGTTAGLFKATTGKIEIYFPFTEHATILEGEVTLTDETGQSHTYKAGDSYFIRQGQTILWDVKGKQVIKSFFNIVEAQ